MLQSFSGARIRRVIDRSHARVPEHAHEWPVLSLFVLGSYLNRTEMGEHFICGPSAVFYRAGVAHSNEIAAVGFEQIEIEFDPSWLGRPRLPGVPVALWLGGPAGKEAWHLARACAETPEVRFRAALHRFMERATEQATHEPVSWIGAVTARLRQDTTLKVNELAREAGRHASWVGSAYRRATGEGLQEAAARFRLERAAHLLRETDEPYAAIACESGFCDQSHMNRTFRRLLGRTPSAVRHERHRFRII